MKSCGEPGVSLPRPPVVVVLGHVDHGKTTLLDTIRKTAVAAREHGGITQSIGAYQTTPPATSHELQAVITFIDTPGHEAFSQMRSRGVAAADIAILVVAANDSVMPQTAEAIKTIQEAKIPYIVALNKTDLPEANIDKTIQDLLRHNVLLENYGGSVPWIKISAKTGEGVKALLDLIVLLAQMSNLASEPEAPLRAIIIEARLDKNRGPVATVIVREGILRSGQTIFFRESPYPARALVDFRGRPLQEAPPGTPAEILGLSCVPTVGEIITDKPTAPPVPAQKPAAQSHTSGNIPALNIILRADNLGSLEAIRAKLPANIAVLESGSGEVTEKDILLAKTTGAAVVGFNTKPTAAAGKLAETEKVPVRSYKIIYELLGELQDAASGAGQPPATEEVLGKGEIIAEFPYEKRRVAGIRVTEGRIARGDQTKIKDQRSKIKDLRIGKEEMNKVEKGKECGVLLEPQVDFQIGDAIISYRLLKT